jgi:protein-S-isoprenylcysteine O-methyltransferase Ste14
MGSVKVYVVTTGVICALVTLAHLARIVAEPNLARDPFYILLTILVAALTVWAWRLYKTVFAVSRRAQPGSGVIRSTGREDA